VKEKKGGGREKGAKVLACKSLVRKKGGKKEASSCCVSRGRREKLLFIFKGGRGWRVQKRRG